MDDDIKKMIGQMEQIKRSVMLACLEGSMELLQVLIEGGGDVNTANADGITILMISSQHGYVNIVEFLIQNGADKTTVDSNGKNALDYAEETNHGMIADILR